MNEHFTRRQQSSKDNKKKPASKKGKQDRLSSMLMELEQRIAFDAAGAVTIDQAQDQHPAQDSDGTDHQQSSDATDSDQHALEKALAGSTEAAITEIPPMEAASKQVVFVDSSVTLLQGIDGDFEVVVLEAGRDGVKQLAEALSHMKDVETVHIISHGDEGRLYLGSAELTIESMAGDYADELQSLKSYLTDDADILIYGCDFARGELGQNAARMMGYLTGADIAASTDATGNAALGGDWDLEYRTGEITASVLPTMDAQREYAELLNVQASVGNGALLVVSGRTLYSVDVVTGKATAITTAPATIGGVSLSDTLNSLAVDQANGLIYYTDSASANANRALFAYDFINNTHILIDNDLTNNGTGLSIVVGERGVGSGAATFYNGSLYLGIENINANGDDQIWRITFSGNGRTIASASTFGAAITTSNDWGDFAIDTTNNYLLSLNGAAATITRYNLATGAIVGSYANPSGTTLVQGGGDINGNTYLVGASLQQINVTTGAAIGSAIAITTNGTTPIGTISDGARWVPPTGTIGDQVYDDNNLNGTFDSGDVGIANVTVQLIDDVNGNGVADAGERVLATDTTGADGRYLFTGVLPGQYVVRVTDTAGVLGGAVATKAITQSAALTLIGGANLAADFGYDAQAPVVDLNSGTTPTQIITNGGTPGTTGWTVTGTAGGIANDGYAWTLNGGTGTLTQANITGWRDGLAPSGAAQLTFDVGWSNNLLLGISNDNNTPATLDVTIGGVLYARVTTGTLNGTPNTATITYFNGASGSPSTVAASAAGTTAWTRTGVTINLPSTVAATGDLVFSYSAAGGLLTPSTDDIFIDNVSAFRNVDTVAGVNYTTTYTENGAGVSIASTTAGVLADVRDFDSTTMRSATIVLTNAQAGDLLSVGTLPSGITGSIDTTVAGQITVNLTGTATKANYAAAIRAITFSNSGDNPGTTARVINVTVNDGGLSSAVAVSTINVIAVNDAPVNTLPASGWTTNEDTSFALSGLSIADVDAGTGNMTVTLNVATGAITAISGGSVTVTGSGTTTITLTGTLANINAYLASAAAPVYVPVADANGAVTLTMTTNDNGNTGTGGALTDIDVRTITIIPVNDAPVLDLDGSSAGTGYSIGYTENGSGVAIAANNNSVIDVDNANMASATIVITNGQAGDILAATGTLPTGITASYNATTFTLTLTGSATKAAYQAALAQILYSSSSDNPTIGGTATGRTISVTVNDGALASNTAITTVAVTAVNDAPVNTLPASGWTTNEDTNVALSGLSILDLDAVNGTMTVTLGVSSGTITATSGCSVTVSGSGTATLTLSGTLTNINAYLASASAPIYVPVPDANGAITLTMTTNDNGNTGTGGALTDIDIRTITIIPVNDPPILDLDTGSTGTGYSTTYTEKGASVAITGASALITDVDNTNMSSLTVVITNGQAGDLLALSSTIPGITASYNAATFTLTLTGSATKADYQTALQAVRYSTTSDNPSTIGRTINVVTNDGAANSNTAVATVNVIAVNDAPVNTLPTGPVTLQEDVLTAITGLSVTDADSTNLTVTLTVTNGILSPSTIAGTVTGVGTNTVTISGTQAQVNSVLASLRYQGNPDYYGSDTLTMVTSDGSLTDTDTLAISVTPVADIVDDTVTTNEDTPITFNVITGTNGASADNFENPNRAITSVTQPPAGQGSVTFSADGTITYTPTANFNGQTTFTYTVTSGGVTEVATVTVNVAAVNDAPVNTLPASGWTTNEDTNVALTGLSVADVDAGTGAITVQLSVTSGTLTATSGNGVVISGSGSTITLTGTLASINAYLASSAAPIYVPVANANGSVTLTMTTNDGGNTGSGGPLTDIDTRPITINAVNDAPVNTLPASYTIPEDTPLGLTDIQISDVDAGNGTMTVTLGVNSGILTASAAGGVTVSGSGTGTIILSGTLANINAFLASASRPSFTPVADFNGNVTLTMTTNDGGNTGAGGALTDVDTSIITVTPVNDAPILDLDASGAGTGFTTSYTENGAGIAIVDTDVLIVDVDNTNMASATIIITNAVAGDTLSIAGTLPSGITFSYNAATATLTLTGFATKADYQTALQQIRYSSTSDDPGSTARIINISVNDGTVNSNVALATVSVTPVNDPPVNTLPGSYTMLEDGTLSLSGLSVLDPDAGTSTMTVTLSVNSGSIAATSAGGVTVSGSGTGTITLTGTLSSINAYLQAGASQPVYSPVADFNGTVTLTMTSSDGSLTDTDSRTITVTPVVDIFDDAVTTNEDTAATIDVNANDNFENAAHQITAINGTSIVANGVVTVANGSVRLNANGTLTFIPTANYNGQTSFTYTVTSGGVTETANVVVTVTPVNDAPVNTVPGAQTTAEDSPLAIGGVNVSDVDGDTLTTTVSVTNGSLSVTAGGGSTISNNGTGAVTIAGTAAQINAALAGLSYTPTADYNGAAQLTVVTSDGTLTDTDSIAITVTPVADIANDVVTTNEDTAITIDVNANDTFENSGHTITAINGTAVAVNGTVTVANGTARLNANGTITFTPTANYNGQTSFTYTVTSGGVTETATVTVNVTAVNDAPVNTVPGTQTIAEDGTITFSVAGGNAISVADVDNGTLTVTLTVTNGTFSLSGISGLTFTAGDGTSDATMTFSGTTAAINAALAGATYVPTRDYNGSAQITLTTSDGSLSDVDTINVTITAVADIANDSVSTDEDMPVTIAVLANDTFDNPGRAITAINGTAITTGGTVAVSNGTVQLTSGGQLIFTPTLDYNGVTTFTYTVTSGGVTETATVTVAVASVNTPPINTIPSTYTTLEDTALGLTGLSIADADAGNGIVTVTLSVNSGILTASNTGGVTVQNSGSGEIVLSGTITAINANLSGASRPSFTPVANSVAAVTLTMTTNDMGNTGGPALTDIDTSTISITPVNDAPSGGDKTITLLEDGSYTFAAADFGFTDPNDSPANTLSAVIISTLPSNGVLSLGGVPVTAGQVISAANIGSLTFTPTANANGAALASFTFQVRDNGGTANGGVDTDPTPNTITFNVTAVNDAPVNTLPGSFATNEDIALTLTGLAISDVDAGNSNVTVTLSVGSGTLSAATGGSVTVTGSGTGTITLTGTVTNINTFLAGTSRPLYTPVANANGSVTLTMVTNDNGNTGIGGPLSDTDTATIFIATVNDAPVGADAAISLNEDTVFSGTLPVATDVDGDTLSYSAGSLAPAHGVVTINSNGTYIYTPAANFNGTDTFRYRVSDGTVSVEYTVTVTVNAVNDAPVAINDTAQTLANSNVSTNVLTNDTDVDGDTLIVSQVNGVVGNVGMAVAGSNGGTFTIGANGAAIFNPGSAFVDLAAGQTRTSSVTYQVSDGNGGTATATFTVTVTGINDAPVSTPIANQSSNDTQVISLNVSGNFSDPDAGDSLTFTATGLPPGLTISAAGVITGTINRSASVNGPYSVTITATDRAGAQATRSFTWAVANPAPIAGDDNFATTENAAISGSVFTNDSDPDGDPISVSAVGGNSAAVGAAVNGSNGGTFIINADGTYAFNPGTSFDNLAAGQTRVTSVTYTISDGQGGTATATVTVTVTGENDAPIAGNDSFTTNEDTPVIINVLANDSDIDGGTLTITAINDTVVSAGNSVNVTGGRVTLNANGTLTFTPTADYNGTPSFTYTVSDGQGGSTTATVNGTVNAVQDPPVAVDDTFTSLEDTAVTINVRANDYDVDGDPLTITQINGLAIVTGGSVAVTGGTVTLNTNGTLTFNPTANYNGNPSFTYTISDGQGGTATATVNGTVTPVQDPPIATGDTFTTLEDTPTTIAVLANDSDPDGDPLTIIQINGTAISSGATVAVTGGTITLNANGTLTFNPTANYNGSTSFTYTISDGQGGTATATVNGTITPVNDAPVAVDDTFTTLEDTATTINVRGNDSDVDGDALTITQINGTAIVTGATVSVTGGTVTLNANGTLTFTPTPNYNGNPSFTYTISDGNGGTATATVNGTVTPINDAPVAVNDTFTTPEDTAITFDVRSNDSDADGDALTVTAINGTAITTGQSVAITGGTVRLDADGRLSFTPNANYHGPINFTYTVSDGTAFANATVSGTVTPVNDAPTSSDISISTQEDTPFNGTLVATDVDGDAVTFSLGTTTPAHGTVTINANGTYIYTPSANYNGTDRFSFVVTDPSGARNEYTVTITVTDVNDNPVGTPIPNRSANDGAVVNFDVSTFFSDVDGDTLTYSQTGLPSGLSISAAGLITGTIDRNASQGVNNGVYTVTISVSDGNGGTAQQTFSIAVSNPAPIAVNDVATTLEDTAIIINVLANDSDPDGDPLSVISATAAHGTVTILADGEISYLPSANYNGTDIITYTISDGNGGTATATVTVTITPVNDDPVGTPIADRTRNDGATDSLDLSAFFSDPEGGVLTYQIDPDFPLPPGLLLSGSVISGQISSDASGPTGEKSYRIRVIASDPDGGSTVVEFTYTVLNIPPIARDDTVTTNEDTSVDINVLANDSDPDGDLTEVIRVNNVVLQPNGASVATTNGFVQLIENPDGSQFLRFTPSPNYNGRESFSYSISDGNGGVSTATVTVTVVAVNDPPTPTQPIPDRVRADGQSFTYNVSDFFTDPDGDPLSFTISGLPVGLQYNPATGLISGVIDKNASQGGPNNNGVYIISIIANDGTTSIPAQTFELTVTNPAPTANNDVISTNEDTPVVIEPLANDSDPDGDPLTIVTARAGVGTVTINPNGTLTYVPALNFNGVDTISYTISDGNGGVSTATVRVTVNAVNDDPTSSPIPDQYDSDSQFVDYDVSHYFSDVDGDTLTFTATNLPPGLTMDAAGRITGRLAPNASDTGPYQAVITASDGNGGTTTRTVTWIVTNLPPQAFHDTLIVDENTSGGGNVLDNDLDPDGDDLTVDQVEGSSANVGVAVAGSNGGTFTINADGTYTFDPGTDFADMSEGDAPRFTSITYRVTDGTNVDTATITVTVNGVNNDPTANIIPDYTRADGQSLTDHPLHLGAFFQDIDANDTLTFSQTGLPDTLTMATDGTITGILSSDASQGGPNGDGIYTVVVTANDGKGGTISQTFTFTATNPAPIAENDTVVTGEDQPVTFNPITGAGTTSGDDGIDFDPDGDTIIIDPAFPPVAGNGTVVVNPNGTLTYTPNANYNGSDTIVYRITDGQGGFSTGIITVFVDAENDPPIASPIADMSRNDGEAISFNVSGNFVDPEGQPLSYTATGLPPGLSINATTGIISGTIDADASGPTGLRDYVVRVTATDPDGGSASVDFTYTIKNVAPNAENDQVTTDEDTPVEIDILANDTDPDGDTDTVILVEGVNLTVGGPAVMTSNGSVQLVLNASGKEVLRFTPNPNFNGTESFTYTISDRNGGSDTATVTVTVNPVNDPPVATPIPDRTQVDSSDFSLDVRPYFTDVDGQVLTITVSGLPPELTFDPATGLITGRLDADASKDSPYTITVRASDGIAQASSTFTLTVTNPAPNAANDVVNTLEDTVANFNPITGAGTLSGADGIDSDPDGDPLTITQINGQSITVGQTVIVAGGSVRLNDALGNLTFTPTLNFNGTVGFTYRISDGNGGFSDASVTLNIAAVNDTPIIDLNGPGSSGSDNSVTFTEGDGPVRLVSPDAIVSDVENGIVSLDVSLSGFLNSGTEIIHLNGSADIIFGTASSGMIAFGGTTFVYQYDGANSVHFENAAGASVPMPNAAASALLRALQYENRNANLTAGDRTLTISITDNGGETSAASVTVSVGAINNPPVAVDDTAITGENTAITNGTSVLANDSDAEGATLTVIAVGSGNAGQPITGSAGGTFVINADGTYSFNPNTDFDDLQEGQTRTTSVSYTISDGAGGTATATLTITVTGENDAPSGGSFTLNAIEDQTSSGFLPVTDVDDDNLIYAVLAQPANGTVTIGVDGRYTFVPKANFSGPDSFTYTVNDGKTTVTFTVTVNVANVEDPPTGEIPNQSFNDADRVTLDISQFFTDADGDTLSFNEIGLPAGLEMSAEGVITGILTRNASQVDGGVYVITVTVSDGQQEITRDFTITVSNPAPIARNDAITTEENTPASGSVFADNGFGADSDPDGDVITVSAVNGNAAGVGTSVTGSAGGSFNIAANGNYTFTPSTDFDNLAAGQTRTTSVTYTISDGEGGTSTATFTVTVTGTNDAPVGRGDTISVVEDTPYNGTLPVAFDAEGQTLTYAVGTGPTNGRLVVNIDGTYTYTPNPNFAGGDSFIYTVSDGTATVQYTVVVNVCAINDAPTLGNDSFTVDEDGTVTVDVLANDSDADGDTLTITAIDGKPIVQGGSVTVTGGTIRLNANGTLTFTGAANFNGPLTFTYTVSDGTTTATATVTGQVNAINDSPIAVDDVAQTDENTPIGGNVIIGSDSDPDGDTLTVISVGTGPNGVGATLTGSNGGSFVILADGSYRFDPGAAFQDLQAGESRATSISYTISDGNGGTATATLTITVTGVNDAPVAPALPPRANLDGTVINLDLGSLFSDVDGDTLTYTIGGLPTGLIYNQATAVITGTISPSASGPTGTRAFSVTVTANDGNGGTVQRNFIWTVTNPIPQAQDDAFSINEGQTLTGNVLANNGNGADTDDDVLTVSVVNNPANGTLTLNSDGSFTYQPNAFFNGSDSFTYRVADGNSGFDTATVTIQIAAVNDAPVVNNDTFAIDEDGSVTIDVLANDSDPDNDPLTITAINGQAITAGNTVSVTGGTVTLNANGTLTFTATPNYNGSPSFSYTVTDGTVSRDGTVSGTVRAINDAPVNTLPGSFTGTEDTNLPLTGIAVTDVDAGNAPITVTLTVNSGALLGVSANGVTVTGNGFPVLTLTGTVNNINAWLSGPNAPVYRPVTNSSASVTLTMTTNDGGNTGAGGALTATSTATIIIDPVNDAPVAVDQLVTTPEDTPVAGTIVASDVDGDALTYTISTQPANGRVTIDAMGRYLYTPATNFNGTDVFVVTVSDGHGGTATATVTVSVAPINDAPVGSDGAVTVTEDIVFNGQLPEAIDPEGQAVLYAVGTPPMHGTLTINPDGSYSYRPASNYNGNDSFTYTVSDGVATSTYMISITITAVNDAPVGSDLQILVANGATATGSLPPAIDPEGSDVTYALDGFTPGATVIVNEDGTYSYTPAPGFSGTDTFTYSVSDGSISSVYTVTVTVGAANQPPVAVDATVATNEDQPLSGRLPIAIDPEGGTVTYSLGRDALNGSVIVNRDGTYTYTPNPNFYGTDSFTYIASDGTASSVRTITINVAEVNDAPVGSDTSIAVTEDIPASGMLPRAIDPEGQTVIYGLGDIRPAHGSVIINADGSYTYTPNANFNGTDSFTYTVSDGDATNTYTVSVTVSAVNDAPIGRDDLVSVNENAIYNGRLPTATDPDGDTVFYGLGSQANNGFVTINPDGTYTYTPNENFNGTDTFTYTVSDGQLERTYTVTVLVNTPNEPPVSSDTSISVTEGTVISGNLPAATDPEGQPITYGLGSGPQHGTVTINADGTYSYTPASGYNGADSFTFTISDGVNTVTYTVTVNVLEAGGPRPPLEVDPPAPISAEPTDPWQPPSVSESIPSGSALTDSIMEDLNGIADLTAQGPILNVVNSIRSLNGIGSLPDQGAILHAVRQIGDWQASDRIIDEIAAGFFKGGSNIHLSGEGNESTWFQVDTMFYKDYLYIMPSSAGNVENANFGVTLADGKPLPDWLKPTRQGLVIGRPPAGLPSIDLRIYGNSADGVISDTMRIDLHTGTILDHVSDRRTDLGPAMFSDHLFAAANLHGDDISVLSQALESWNELPQR
ncbi:tandem-95 repeat protein [Agrobacterium sp. AGB01]|uniref:Ig-like domain-containing protein n=1 Tax=Agrobacterium sp. AGB01 TaxID=2769302 RepID=UPI0017809601|nr:Ig-like domain-containing protein [Agrobacterium sp. AGB01]MBD9387908.1 tandem-95 repeat protein [Agrobacterium sp. AGB01]